MAEEEQPGEGQPTEDQPIEVKQKLEIPHGAIMQNSLLVVAYYDHEGVSRYAFGMVGDTSLAQALGLLEIVQHHLVQSAYTEFGNE